MNTVNNEKLRVNQKRSKASEAFGYLPLKVKKTDQN